MGVVVTVAPTGPIATKADNPHLPTSPEEIAEAVADAYRAGASVAHIHLRDEHQRPTADLDIARRTIGLIAERCPVLIQLSTGVGLGVPFEERERLVELRPRMATLNPCSMSFGDGEFRNPPDKVRRLAARMRDLGIKPELEIYDTGHLEACLRLWQEGLLAEPLQFSLVLGVRGGMAATADNLLTMVRRLPPGAIWQVIAIGRTTCRSPRRAWRSAATPARAGGHPAPAQGRTRPRQPLPRRPGDHPRPRPGPAPRRSRGDRAAPRSAGPHGLTRHPRALPGGAGGILQTWRRELTDAVTPGPSHAAGCPGHGTKGARRHDGG